VGFGGNEEQTLEAFRAARSALSELMPELRSSSLYRTEPQLDTDQARFWNAAVTGLWAGDAWELLKTLQSLEAAAGRHRDAFRPKGPRDSARLQIPHQGLLFRRFALEPLLELSPSSLDPVTGASLSGVCSGLPAQGVERWAKTW